MASNWIGKEQETKYYVFLNKFSIVQLYIINVDLPSNDRCPFCARVLVGSFNDITSFALLVLAYGYKISFSLGSRWILLRKSSNCCAVITDLPLTLSNKLFVFTKLC